MLLRTTGAAARAAGGLLSLVGKRAAALASSASGGVATASAVPSNPLILLRALSTAPPKQQRKGEPSHSAGRLIRSNHCIDRAFDGMVESSNHSTGAHKIGKTLPTRTPQRVSAPTLEGKPPAVILDKLKQKCEGASRPRLSDLHTLLEAARRDEGSQGTGAVLQEALALFVKKNVEFREETASLFLRAMCRAGQLMGVCGWWAWGSIRLDACVHRMVG